MEPRLATSRSFRSEKAISSEKVARASSSDEVARASASDVSRERSTFPTAKPTGQGRIIGKDF